MQPHNINIKDKIITINDYSYRRNPPKKYSLNDKVMAYFDGYDRKIVPLDIAYSYPIIYDKYIASDQQFHDMTIAICPFTLACATFDGKFVPTDYVENSCLVITNNKDTFAICNSFNHILKLNHKKFEIDIKILRNIFTEYPDCKYITLNKDIDIQPLINPNYYLNKDILFEVPTLPSSQFHYKTLTYLIQYISSKDQSVKSTIIIGRNANKDTSTGYNVIESGIYDYIMQYDNDIKQKFGLVMPILWFAWKSFFPNSKIIYLP